MKKRSLLVPVSLCLLDMVLTLCGQSSVYWDGEFRNVTEASPAFATYLAIHPGVFVAAGLVWIAAFTTLASTLPIKLGRVVSIAVSIGHAVGALAWMFRIARELAGGMEAATENSPSMVAYFAVIVLISLVAVAYSQISTSANGMPRKVPDLVYRRRAIANSEERSTES